MVFKHVLMLKPFGIAHRTGKYHLPTKNIFWVTLSLDLPYEAQPVGCFQAKIRFWGRNIWFLVPLHNGNRFGAWPKGSIPIFRSLEWFWISIVFFCTLWNPVTSAPGETHVLWTPLIATLWLAMRTKKQLANHPFQDFADTVTFPSLSRVSISTENEFLENTTISRVCEMFEATEWWKTLFSMVEKSTAYALILGSSCRDQWPIPSFWDKEFCNYLFRS